MTLDKIKTGTGRKLRGEPLQETALPIPYDAAAMPGATVLGTDGELYASLKVGGVYVWRRVIGGLNSGEVFLGLTDPRTNFLTTLKGGTPVPFVPGLQVEGDNDARSSISITRAQNADDAVSRLILAKSRSATLGGNGAVLDGDSIGTILFDGDDGDAMMPGAAISAEVKGTPSSGDVPMQLLLRTRAQGSGPVGITARLRITPDGNVLINNTSGTEKLDVTGNIKASGALISSTLQTTGQSARTQALVETALPIALDPATVPGATVLGTDGQIYTSTKINGAYSWDRVLNAERILIGPDKNNFLVAPADPVVYNPAIQIEGANNPLSTIAITRSGNGQNNVSRILLCRARGEAGDTITQDGDSIANLMFLAHDGTWLRPASAISTFVEGAPVAGDSVPGSMRFRTAPAGGQLAVRMWITSDGNVLINNGTGTERLSVTGNIQVTESTDSFKVGTNNVVGSRKTGWAAPTGTATRTTFATYAGQDASATYVEAEVQAIDDHVKVLSERLKALIDDLTTHGLIGT